MSYTQGAGIDEPLAMLRGGVTSYYQADGLGSITSVRDGNGGLVASYTYDTFGNLAASTGTLTNPFRYTGREIERDIRNGATTVVSTVRTNYDILGRLTSRTNPYAPGDSQLSTSYAYDTLGRVTTVTPPSAGYSQYAYSGNAVTTTDPAGKQRRSYTDALGRLIEVDEPGWGDGLPGKGSVTITGAEQHMLNCGDQQPPHCPTEYDEGWVSITVNGVTETATYGRFSTTSTVAGDLASAFNGDPNSPVNAGINGTTINLTAKVANGSTNYSLSTSAASTDPYGLFGASFGGTRSGPTLTGARDATVQANPSMVTPMMTTYTYDVLDDLTAVSQAGLASVGGVQVPGQPRSYVYDSLGRLTTSTTPESGTSTFSYLTSGGAACAADASAVCRKTDARSVTSTYSYDGLNRVTGVTYSDGVTPAVAYGYDAGGAGAFALGRLTSVTVGSGSPAIAAESYTYDQLGRITQAQESVGGTPYAVNYTYNPDNSLATIQYPSGRVVSQSYDPIGRLATLASGGTNYLSGLSYNAAGQALGFTYGNQVQAAFTYNDHLQLATLRYSMTNKPDLLNLAYDYTTGVPGNNGQIQKIHYYSAPGTEDLSKSENFSYDPWSRLATAGTGDNSTWGLGWNYDRFGNRLNQNVTAGSAPSPSVTVDANTNRINTSGYSYDAAGNMTNDALHTFTYDAENRITTVNTNLATYTYLGALRVKKVAGATSAVYVYSGTKPIQEYENGSLKREYIYAGGGPMLATVTWSGGTSTTTYQHPDHLSIRAESDANGNLIRSTGHFPFGEAWYDTSPGSKWQFTSYERDSESGLDYAMFRSYSSRLGRFMQADLLAGNLGNPESVNRYTYVLNDPEDLVDPLGLLECYLRVIITRDQNGTITEIEALGVWCVGFAGGPRGGNTPEDKKVVQEKQNCANNVLAALNAQRQDYLNGQDKRMLMRMGVGALQGAWTGAKAGAEMGALEGIEGGPPGEGVGAGGGAALGAVIGGIFGAGSAVLVGTPVEIATQYSTGQQFLAETKKDLTSICGVNVQ